MTVAMRSGAVIQQTATELTPELLKSCQFLLDPWLGINKPNGNKLCISTADISYVELVPEVEKLPEAPSCPTTT